MLAFVAGEEFEDTYFQRLERTDEQVRGLLDNYDAATAAEGGTP
jgi:hypothetical protein